MLPPLFSVRKGPPLGSPRSSIDLAARSLQLDVGELSSRKCRKLVAPCHIEPASLGLRESDAVQIAAQKATGLKSPLVETRESRHSFRCEGAIAALGSSVVLATDFLHPALDSVHYLAVL